MALPEGDWLADDRWRRLYAPFEIHVPLHHRRDGLRRLAQLHRRARHMVAGEGEETSLRIHLDACRIVLDHHSSGCVVQREVLDAGPRRRKLEISFALSMIFCAHSCTTPVIGSRHLSKSPPSLLSSGVNTKPTPSKLPPSIGLASDYERLDGLVVRHVGMRFEIVADGNALDQHDRHFWAWRPGASGSYSKRQPIQLLLR